MTYLQIQALTGDDALFSCFSLFSLRPLSLHVIRCTPLRPDQLRPDQRHGIGAMSVLWDPSKPE